MMIKNVLSAVVLFNSISINAMEAPRTPFIVDQSQVSNIQTKLIDRVNRLKSLDPMILEAKNFKLKDSYAIPFGNTGYIGVPDSLTTTQMLKDFILSKKLQRTTVSIQDYMKAPLEMRSIIVGSGLAQELVQPLQGGLKFQTPFYIDSEADLFPDLIGEFNSNLVSAKFANYKESFDGIYLDNFEQLYSRDILSAVFSLLKPGCELRMPLRTNGNGLMYSSEEAMIFNNAEGNMRFAEISELNKEVTYNALIRRLQEIGFHNTVISSSPKSIHQNGWPIIEVSTYKPVSNP